MFCGPFLVFYLEAFPLALEERRPQGSCLQWSPLEQARSSQDRIGDTADRSRLSRRTWSRCQHVIEEIRQVRSWQMGLPRRKLTLTRRRRHWSQPLLRILREAIAHMSPHKPGCPQVVQGRGRTDCRIERWREDRFQWAGWRLMRWRMR